jgi:hypothetical protein
VEAHILAFPSAKGADPLLDLGEATGRLTTLLAVADGSPLWTGRFLMVACEALAACDALTPSHSAAAIRYREGVGLAVAGAIIGDQVLLDRSGVAFRDAAECLANV